MAKRYVNAGYSYRLYTIERVYSMMKYYANIELTLMLNSEKAEVIKQRNKYTKEFKKLWVIYI